MAQNIKHSSPPSLRAVDAIIISASARRRTIQHVASATGLDVDEIRAIAKRIGVSLADYRPRTVPREARS